MTRQVYDLIVDVLSRYEYGNINFEVKRYKIILVIMVADLE